MDINFSTNSASSNASTVAGTGGGQTTANADSSSAMGTAQGTFTQVLEGQTAQKPAADEPTDTAVELAGLLQMLQSLTLPNLVPNDQVQTEEQLLPEALLQAMNSNPSSADSLLQDPALQQWFTQASDLLSVLSGKDSAFKSALSPQMLQASELTNLQAQNTLLTLSSLLKQEPDNPFLKHLLNNLQQAIEPLMPKLSDALLAQANGFSQVQAQSQVILQSADSGTESLPDNAKLADNEVAELFAFVRHPGFRTANNHEIGKTKDEVQSDFSDLLVVQAPKSKLDALAAKTAAGISLIQSQAPSDINPEKLAVIGTETGSTDTAITNVTDFVKAPVQADHTAKATPTLITAGNFAEEMSRFLHKNMKITLNGEISEAKISLFPKHLGHVDVKITLHEGQLIAQFATDSLAGKQMLESQLSQLRQTLQSQGIQVEKLEVTQNQSAQTSLFQDQRHQHSSRQQSQPNRNSVVNYDQEISEFVQELSGATQSRSSGYGNSFDVTA